MGLCESVKSEPNTIGSNSTQYSSNFKKNYNNYKIDNIQYLNTNEKMDNKNNMQQNINYNASYPYNNQLQVVNEKLPNEPQLIQNNNNYQNELIKSIKDYSNREKELNKKIENLEKEKLRESTKLNELSKQQNDYINKINSLVKERDLESTKAKNLELEKTNILNKYTQIEGNYKAQILSLNNEKAIFTNKEKQYNDYIQKLKTQINEKEQSFNKLKNTSDNEKLIIEKQKNTIKELEDKLKNKNNISPKGLNNIGATCYMNATLQCLFYTSELTNYFQNQFKYNPYDKSKLISNEYYKVVKKLLEESNINKSYSPDSFKIILSQENTLFAGVTANDSKDLINFLLERLHNELNIVDKNTTKKNNYVLTQEDQLYEDRIFNVFLNEFKEKYNSIISNLFYGVLETKSQCQGCGKIKFNFQVYSFVEFPLEQVNIYCFNMGKRNNYMNNNTNPDIDLYECFEYNCKIDLMTGDNQMFCNFCHCLCNTRYGTSLYSLPNYLIINLNRGKGAVYKCNVNFPEQLNLFNFVNLKNSDTVFELYGVICHIGPSSMNGHFIAYCKNKNDRKWYKYNDAMVTPCEKNDEYKNGMPYILFYQAL